MVFSSVNRGSFLSCCLVWRRRQMRRSANPDCNNFDLISLRTGAVQDVLNSARILSTAISSCLRKGAIMFEGLFQPMHLLVIFGIALLVFGPKKLPELGKGIGEGIRGFKSAMKAEDEKPATTASTIANE